MQQIHHPDLWRKLVSRPSLTWMEFNLYSWLRALAGNTAGDLQRNVRALMLRASSPMPVSDGSDEVASLRKQLRHQQQTHREMQTMLKTKPGFGNRDFPEQVADGWSRSTCICSQDSCAVRGLRTCRTHVCTTI